MIGGCARESDIRQASASGRWTPELQLHLRACDVCRDLALVVTALSGDAPAPPRRTSPAILWARARHARRLRAEAIASRILAGGQMATAAVGLGVLAWLGARLDLWSSSSQTGPTGLAATTSIVLTILAATAAGWLWRRV